jgi:hypothetical protein
MMDANESNVIPRLAQRAEGPLKRLFRYRKTFRVCVISAAQLCSVSQIATARSLGVLRQPRDDSSLLF